MAYDKADWENDNRAIISWHDIPKEEDVWKALETTGYSSYWGLSESQKEYFLYFMVEKIREYNQKMDLNKMARITVEEMKKNLHEHDGTFTVCESTKDQTIVICKCGAWRFGNRTDEEIALVGWSEYPDGLDYLIDAVNPNISPEDKKAALNQDEKLQGQDYTAMVALVAMHLNMPKLEEPKNPPLFIENQKYDRHDNTLIAHGSGITVGQVIDKWDGRWEELTGEMQEWYLSSVQEQIIKYKITAESFDYSGVCYEVYHGLRDYVADELKRRKEEEMKN